MNFNNVAGSFFNEKDVDFEIVFNRIIKWIDFCIDFNALFDVAMKWKEILYLNQNISEISSERVEISVEGFKDRICKLKSKFDDIK